MAEEKEPSLSLIVLPGCLRVGLLLSAPPPPALQPSSKGTTGAWSFAFMSSELQLVHALTCGTEIGHRDTTEVEGSWICTVQPEQFSGVVDACLYQ